MKKLWLLLAAIGAATQAQIGDPLGTKRVIVIACQYPNVVRKDGTRGPMLADTDIVRCLTSKARPYYETATESRTLPEFRPASEWTGYPRLTLQTKYEAPPLLDKVGGTIDNDPLVVNREGMEAVSLVDEAAPELLTNPENRTFIVVVNARKRGMAFPFMTYASRKAGIVGVGVTVVPVTEIADAYGSGSGLVSDSTVTVDANGNMIVSVANKKLIDNDFWTTAAHEFGHLCGHPDLYRETAFTDLNGGRLLPGPEFVGRWCLMAKHTGQNFSAYCRMTAGWCPPERIAVMTPPAPGSTVTRTYRIWTATHGSSANKEIVLIPGTDELRSFSPTLAAFLRVLGAENWGIPGTGSLIPFTGYILEARQKNDRDKKRERDSTTGLDLYTPEGLPDDHAKGVLVSQTRPWLPGVRYPPVNPLTVIEYKPQAAGSGELPNAAIPVGQSMSLGILGVTISVTAEGINYYDVTVKWTLPPLPNVAVTDAWIDAPNNDYGTFLTGATTNGAPPLFGDAIFRPIRVKYTEVLGVMVPSGVEIGTATHRITYRIKNVGQAPIGTVKGNLSLMGPALIFTGLDLSSGDPIQIVQSIVQAQSPWRNYDVGSGTGNPFKVRRSSGGSDFPLQPGEVADVTVEYKPAGPTMAVLRLNQAVSSTTPVQTEPLEWWLDNFGFEPFLASFTWPGSPYQPIVTTIPMKNANQTMRRMSIYTAGIPAPSPTDTANRWQVTTTPVYAIQSPNAMEKYTVTIQPPDPGKFKPNGINRFAYVGMMNHGDVIMPVGEIPVDVIFVWKTRITAKLDKMKGIVSGTLERQDPTTQVWSAAPAGQQLNFNVTFSDGTEKLVAPGVSGYSGATDAYGKFLQAIPGMPTFAQAAARNNAAVVVMFGGTTLLAPSQSATLAMK